MKYTAFFIFCLFFASSLSAQDLRYETEVLEQYDRENQKKSFVGDLTGICDAVTTVTSQGAGIGWDECADNVYEGIVEFELTTEFLYNIYTTNADGDRFNDASFGGYYACYGSNAQGSMPNSDANFPTIYFELTEQGEIGFSGSSQWGEIFSISDVVMNGAQLNFQWSNDYGEGAAVQLVRQDGQLWEELLAPTPVCSICSETDSLALVALYNSTNGIEWEIQWDLSAPVESWYGVTLNESCCVSEIDMGFIGNNLVGEIPDEIGNLSSLELLDLDRNMISGEGLSKLIGLTGLKEMKLAGNQISGEIPIEIGTMPNLEVFSLSANDLTGSIPAEIGTSQSLVVFSTSNNELTGSLPSELSNMPSLEILFSSRNLLTGEIPSEYSTFTSLRQLSVWGNAISGSLDEDLGDVTTLENLAVDYNQLTGEIPANMSSLTRLRLSHNKLEGNIPVGLLSLQELRVNDNNLTGSLPGDLPSANDGLFTINVSNNDLSGVIRDDLISEYGGQRIYLDNNNFESCIETIENLCIHNFVEELDTVFIRDTFFLTRLSQGYNLSNNPKLPWEGNLQNACEGSEQMGAPCDDGNPDTENDGIDEDCNCSENSVSTKDISQLESISINPNPVSSGERMIVSLVVNQGVDMTAQLIDITGKVITNKQITTTEGKNEFTIDSQSINAGLYFLRLSSEDGVTTKKVVVQ